MVKEIPQFRLCPICNQVKPKSEVIYEASLDDGKYVRKVKICGVCFEKALRGERVKQLLQESPGEPQI